MEELDRLRTQINEIDCKLVELYTQRMEVCRAVGQYKKAHDLPVLDAAREKQVLQSKAALVQQPALRPYVTALFEQIMAQSRTLQTKLGTAWPPDKERAYAAYRRAVDHPAALPDRQRVIYQGQPGAYAEQAAVAYFGAACTRTNARAGRGSWSPSGRGSESMACSPLKTAPPARSTRFTTCWHSTAAPSWASRSSGWSTP